MENIEFTGYEPKPVMAQKMAILVDELKALREEVEKLKAPQDAKKPSKVSKTEE